MAYIVSTTQTATASAASYTVTLGAHVSGDLLLVCLSQDGGGTAIAPDATSATAGWAMIGTGAASQWCRGQWAYLIADSASEVNPVFTGANDDWIGTCLVIRDAHATAPLGSVVDGTDFKKADWGNSTNINYGDSGALTSAVNECLLIYSWCSDGNLQYLRCKLQDLTCADKYANTQIAHVIGYRQQQTAAAAPTVRMYAPLATEGGTGWVLAIRNKSGGVLQPDIRPTITELKFHGSWETQQDAITWQSPSNFAATINSITCSSTGPTVAYTTNQQQTPWGNTTALASTESTAGAWVGGTFTIASTDMSGKIFSLQYSNAITSLNAISGAEGILLGFSDGTNWVTYQLVNTAKGWLASDEQTAFVALGQATEYANSDGDSSSSINWAAVTRLGYFVHRKNSVTTSVNLFVRSATLFGNTALTGGGSSRPATWNDYVSSMNSWGQWKWGELQGSAQVKAKTSVQIGDGTNTTYFDGATGSIGYPQAWSSTSNTNWQMDWNVNAGQVTLGVKAGANDTIKLAAGAATTANAQLLTIASDSNSGATYDFAQAFGGFSATWDTDIPAVGATFTGGGQFAGKGADFTNCTWKNSTAGTSAAVLGFDANGAVLDGCTTVATTATGYHIELGTSVTAFTLTDHTFTGSALTDKVHVLRTTDTVTITISGTTSLVAGDVTSAGATVVISGPTINQKVTISGITTGARVQIYDTTSSTELFNGTASAGDTVVSGSTVVWTDPAAATADRAIRVRVSYVSGATAKNFIETSGLTCGQTAGTAEITYPVSPTDDTVYNANAITGSGVTGVTFTDAATDVVNINVVANAISWKTIYAAWVYYVFGATGIASDIDYIDAVDEANYILSNMIIKNTSSPTAPLEVTGGYGRDSVTGATIDLADTTGGTLIFAPDHVVSYAVGSGVTAQDITDIAAEVLTAAASTPIHSDVRKVVGITVDGTGTEGDPWGPA